MGIVDEEPIISKAVGVTTINYKILGDRDAVVKAMWKLFDKYDPTAYGTSCHLIVKKTDGQYEAHVSRATSCD